MYSRRKCNRAKKQRACCCEYKQEAQLSQRDRALLGVIENFAKSLKVIQNDTRANPCVSYRFGDIQR